MTIYFTTLPDRGLVKIFGPGRRAFLQGLITNDINLLDKQPCVYACLLTAQGKFLHDFFITEKEETLFLDCEGGARAEDLARRLGVYKMRADIEIQCQPDVNVYAILSVSSLRKQGSMENTGTSLEMDSSFRWNDSGVASADPRHPAMAYRSFEKPKSLEEKPFDVWDRHRILLTVPDGSRDMIPEKSTLLECNIDKLNGISFDKGCYIGQELTARMHYRGLAKKHLYTVHGPWKSGEEIRVDGELIGEMRSSCGGAGLALLKDEAASRVPQTAL